MSHRPVRDSSEAPVPLRNPLRGWDLAIFVVPFLLAGLASNLAVDMLRLYAPAHQWIVRFLVRVAVLILVFFAVFVPLARWRWKWFRWPR